MWSIAEDGVGGVEMYEADVTISVVRVGKLRHS